MVGEPAGLMQGRLAGGDVGAVGAMPPSRCKCALAQCAGPVIELEVDSTWTSHTHDTAVPKR